MAISLVQYAALSEEPKKKGLVSVITNESIFLKLLMFIKIDGYVYQYNREQTLGGIAFRGLNEDYTDDTTGVINPMIESVAILGGPVKTDRNMANLPPGAAVRASRIASKVKKAGLFFDKYVIDGDPASNGKAFYGLNPRLTGRQVITAGANGAAITLAMVDDLLDRVVGTNDQKILVMNKQQRRALGALYRPNAGTQQRFIDAYEGATIKVLDEDGDEQPILGQDETMGSSAVTSSMYCIRPGSDTDGEYLQGLVNSSMVEHEDQGTRGTQRIDLIEAAMGIALFHPRAASRLQGLL